jgi:hypothetical protein
MSLPVLCCGLCFPAAALRLIASTSRRPRPNWMDCYPLPHPTGPTNASRHVSATPALLLLCTALHRCGATPPPRPSPRHPLTTYTKSDRSSSAPTFHRPYQHQPSCLGYSKMLSSPSNHPVRFFFPSLFSSFLLILRSLVSDSIDAGQLLQG